MPERGSQIAAPDLVAAANRCSAQKRMERLWKNEGATRRKRFDGFKPRTASTSQISLPPPVTGRPQTRW
jgi:hypothetical protein